jgi:hypothetical protein
MHRLDDEKRLRIRNPESDCRLVKSFVGSVPETTAGEQFCIANQRASPLEALDKPLFASAGLVFATLRFTLTGARYSEAFGNGEFNWANASCG